MSNPQQQLDALTDDYVASGLSWHRARAQAHLDLQAMTKAQPKIGDSGGQTMHSMETNKLPPGGRFAGLPDAKPTIMPGQVPRQPPATEERAAPFSESIEAWGGPEPVLGVSIEEQPAVGEHHEIQASLAR